MTTRHEQHTPSPTARLRPKSQRGAAIALKTSSTSPVAREEGHSPTRSTTQASFFSNCLEYRGLAGWHPPALEDSIAEPIQYAYLTTSRGWSQWKPDQGTHIPSVQFSWAEAATLRLRIGVLRSCHGAL
jgi:hypothetical protein